MVSSLDSGNGCSSSSRYSQGDTTTSSTSSPSTNRSERNCDIEKTTKIMQNNPENITVQQKCCQTLWKYIIANKKDVSGIGIAGVIPLLFSAMMLHPKDERVQQYACGTLGEICFISKKDRSIIAENGAINLAITAMKHHPKNAKVQKQACALLGNVLADNPTFCASVHAKDGIGLILKSMDIHDEDPSFQEKACYTLNIVCKKNSAIIHTIKGGGGIYLIARAMKNYPKHRKLQIQALSALCQLAFDSGSLRTICKEEVVDLIVKTLKIYLSDVSVIQKGLATLCNLSARNHKVHNEKNENDLDSTNGSDAGSHVIDIFDSLSQAGAVPLVVGIMQLQQNEVEIQKYSCLFLRNMSCDARGLQTLEKSCQPNFLLSAAKRHSSCEKHVNETLEKMKS